MIQSTKSEHINSKLSRRIRESKKWVDSPQAINLTAASITILKNQMVIMERLLDKQINKPNP